MIYLLHFERPISERHTCQHYLGYCGNGRLDDRIAEHRAGRGSRLCEVAAERGIAFKVVRVWVGDRGLERKIKNRKESGQLCPLCCPDAWHRRGHYAPNWQPGIAVTFAPLEAVAKVETPCPF